MKEGSEIFVIRRGEPEYPRLLANIIDPPAQLYVRGNARLLSTPCFSVVGSRAVTEYGRRAIEKIVTPIAFHFTIVSGMALGADTVAHCVALSAGTPTIAVLGCGLDDESIYPQAHRSFAGRILTGGGCLISEYPPGERARPYYFPARNRIVAGLSPGVLIAEAAIDSGTMITARLALDYGRDVFAIPGSIFSRLCEGTNELIKRGATFTDRSADILEAYGITAASVQQNLMLSSDESMVFEAIRSGAGSINEIATRVTLPLQQVMYITSQLELRSIVHRSAGRVGVLGSSTVSNASL